MAPIDSYIHAHPYNAIALLVLVYNIALYMPPPDEKSGKSYRWLFGVMHAIVLLLPRLASNFIPTTSPFYKLFAGGNGETNGTPTGTPQAPKGA